MATKKTSKNIIICFSGTCNHPSDAKQGREWFGLGEIEDSGITNIPKLHTMFGGNLTSHLNELTKVFLMLGHDPAV